ncbi:MAG: RHS repeat-associated core domain-containing protein, partial [Rhodospirillales bacterium]|nr:RHS repeat-associated core domain-containing protein [Rhodospirillales bacterium]
VDYLVDTSAWLSHVVADVEDGEVETVYVRVGDQLLGLRQGGAQDRFYHLDALGSVRALTNQAGASAAALTYTAFGRRLPAGETGQVYGFAGEPWSPVGLAYHRARWLDPVLGRFGSMDPFGGSGGEPVSLHKYLFANGSPVNRSDPSGMFSVAEMSLVGSIRSVASSIQIDVGISILASEPLDPGGGISNALMLASLASVGFAIVHNWRALITAFEADW